MEHETPEEMTAHVKTAQENERDAERYRWLKSRDLDVIHRGGIFAGLTPENVALSGEDLDRQIDFEMSQRKQS